MHRRDFLKLAALSGSLIVPLGHNAWGATAAPGAPAGKRLVVIMLRGAVDGLNVVTPYGDPGYYAARSSIALGKPGADNGVLDLDGYFGLHPALAPLLPLWQSGQLGFVHASGSPDSTRSHFDAQDYMESGTPGRKATQDGWMNRLLGQLPPSAQTGGLRAVSVGPVLPRIYAGSNPVANMPAGSAATKPTVLDRPAIGDAFARMYAGDDKLAATWQEGRAAHEQMMNSMTASNDDLDKEMQAANNGAPLPDGFPNDAAHLAILLRHDNHIQLAFMALGGWDTHANQGNATGQLANRLRPLGQGLAAFTRQMGPAMNDTVVVVMSEFGRTVHQNGNGGTDHGHGNVMWVLGGDVAGGKVHGQWPGLSGGNLHDGRDLAITTDFRAVLAQVAERHLLLPDAHLAALFPEFAASSASAPRLIRT
ncbi:uncharacterized protein (DUF1501 family) [Silvimonas terrae]|uniref:Uncharacterized protein (DUF1501 family) n=1 Tax=Silvimonas terrae TaxID=300266 RepID=A0A840RF07_9NEIS|nr:DUF1501 domain-containing protein [Silvimonas terrae]MBB5190841.1 uncharacterized protein (DUF1501 family) [Silvimonas terrae]